ncbi:MAG: recombination protein NinB [Phenylobacterium sp.]|nr:recombination protein NinB [Phenylobacterium sp.]
MTPVTVILSGQVRREQAHRLVNQAPGGSLVEITPPGRTLPQNARLHAMITDVARQVEWAGAKRNVEAWKDIFTAALRSANHGLDVVPGINGGFVLLGMHTSRMTKAELGDLMTLVEAFGAEHGVEFTDGNQGGEVPNKASPVAA